MARTYVEFLGSVIGTEALDRRSRHALARAVDDVTVPTGSVVRPADGELVIVAEGASRDLGRRGTLAVSPLRLLVFGRRELRALLDTVPSLATRLFSAGRVPTPREPAPIRSGQVSRAIGPEDLTRTREPEVSRPGG
jgi:hypothetical protein